jgi:thiamine biosynthesis lipoprotein
MGMPVSVEIVDEGDATDSVRVAFDYFRAADERFSPYKETSETSRINRGEITTLECSDDMQQVLRLCERTKRETRGYFDIETPSGAIDPSGLVKGWVIHNVAELLRDRGHDNFYVEAGGDIQTSGSDVRGEEWSIGIRNPFDASQIVKILYPRGCGVATSGEYVRGKHIYDPHTGKPVVSDIASLTVIGPNVYEADRFATAAFAMGRTGIDFIEQLDGVEGYAIDARGIATMTSGFSAYTRKPERVPIPR